MQYSSTGPQITASKMITELIQHLSKQFCEKKIASELLN